MNTNRDSVTLINATADMSSQCKNESAELLILLRRRLPKLNLQSTFTRKTMKIQPVKHWLFFAMAFPGIAIGGEEEKQLLAIISGAESLARKQQSAAISDLFERAGYICNRREIGISNCRKTRGDLLEPNVAEIHDIFDPGKAQRIQRAILSPAKSLCVTYSEFRRALRQDLDLGVPPVPVASIGDKPKEIAAELSMWRSTRFYFKGGNAQDSYNISIEADSDAENRRNCITSIVFQTFFAS
ncbi:hypothetical protein [Roseateles sp.]|uniref:hypothetical protein n=1 Tax=Roseateles sp. TaxID=1971397 RepID=UPI003BABFECD